MGLSYLVIGAGAVGGAIGGALSLAGCDVTLVARGAHRDAIRTRGLTWVTPERREVLRLPVLADAAEAELGPRHVVIVATKSDATADALRGLDDRRVPVVCAQNGVANERIAGARSDRVIGAVVFAPLSHLEPGVVTIHSAGTHGGIDLGLWPTGVDATCLGIAEDLAHAGFDVRVRDDVARWKYGKLLSNLGNVLEAVGGRAALREDWLRAVNEEAERCLAAAGIDHVGVSDIHERFAGIHESTPRAGGSTWQSLARGRTLETEHLNGEIVRLGTEHGVATPWNGALVAIARRAMDERWRPGEASVHDIGAWMPRRSWLPPA